MTIVMFDIHGTVGSTDVLPRNVLLCTPLCVPLYVSLHVVDGRETAAYSTSVFLLSRSPVQSGQLDRLCRTNWLRAFLTSMPRLRPAFVLDILSLYIPHAVCSFSCPESIPSLLQYCHHDMLHFDDIQCLTQPSVTPNHIHVSHTCSRGHVRPHAS